MIPLGFFLDSASCIFVHGSSSKGNLIIFSGFFRNITKNSVFGNEKMIDGKQTVNLDDTPGVVGERLVQRSLSLMGFCKSQRTVRMVNKKFTYVSERNGQTSVHGQLHC